MFGKEHETWAVPDSWGRYTTGLYGYWLLGVAFATLTRSKHIVYIGGGRVGCAEQAFHFHDKEAKVQTQIETTQSSDMCKDLKSYTYKAVKGQS